MGAAIDKIQAEITLNDNGFLDAIDRVNNRTNTFKKAANDATGGNEKLAGSFRSVAQGIAVVDGPFGGVASRVSSVSSLLSGASLAVVGFGAVLAGAGIIMAKSVKAGQELEQQLYKQQAVLKATGYAAGWNSEQLDKMARDTAFATLASVNDIREAQNVMMTFKSVQGDVFAEAVNLSQDLAVVMGGTASSNAKMLGRALEDPIAGITAMTRAGVSFTQSQKDAIKSMVESGNKAKAQKTILAELQKQVGGVGAGEASGLSGSLDTLGQNFETLYENINKVTGASKGFEIVIKGWNEIIARAVDATQEDTISQKLAKLFQKRLELQRQANNSQNKYMHDQFMEEAAAVGKQMDELTALQKSNAKKGLVEYQKGVETRKQIAKDEQAALLKEREKAGAKALVAMDKQTQSEQEKLTDKYLEQRSQLANLVVSEEEIKKRGYTSLAALRLGYQIDLDESYQKDLAALADKQAKEEKLKQEAEKREQDRLDRQKERSMQYFETITDQSARELESKSDYENRRYQKTIERMEKERQALIANNQWTAQNQAAFEKLSEDNTKAHEKKLTEIKKAELQARLNSQREFANIFVGMASSQNKTLAAIGKAAAIYNIGISTYEGAMKAFDALAGIPVVGPALGFAAAGTVIAYGAEQIANVTKQTYHTGGIAGEQSDNYGAKLKNGEINVTLMKGEEVITADDPRHRNNLTTSNGVYESSALTNATPSGMDIGGIQITIDGAGSQDPEVLSQMVAQQVVNQLAQFVSSKGFQSATVNAVGRYAKQNSGKLPNVR